MIKTIIFDIGGVLGRYEWKESMETLGLSEDAKQAITSHVIKAGVWNEADRGLRSDTELEEMVKDAAAGEELHTGSTREFDRRMAAASFFAVRCRFAREYPEAERLVKKYHDQGYQILVLSNYSRTMFEQVASKFHFFQYVDGMVISCQEGCIKPEPQIYRILLDRYGLKAEECVFIDDLPVNRNAAEDFGIHTLAPGSTPLDTERALDSFLAEEKASKIDIAEVRANKRRYTDALNQLDGEKRAGLRKQERMKTILPFALIGAIASLAAVIGLIKFMTYASQTRASNVAGGISALLMFGLAVPILACLAGCFLSARYLVRNGGWIFAIDVRNIYQYVKPDLVMELPSEVRSLYQKKNWLGSKDYMRFTEAYQKKLQEKIAFYTAQERQWQFAADQERDWLNQERSAVNAMINNGLERREREQNLSGDLFSVEQPVSEAYVREWDRESAGSEGIAPQETVEILKEPATAVGDQAAYKIAVDAASGEVAAVRNSLNLEETWDYGPTVTEVPEGMMRSEQMDAEQQQRMAQMDYWRSQLNVLEMREHQMTSQIQEQKDNYELIMARHENAKTDLHRLKILVISYVIFRLLIGVLLFVLQEFATAVMAVISLYVLISGLLGIVFTVTDIFMVIFTAMLIWKNRLAFTVDHSQAFDGVVDEYVANLSEKSRNFVIRSSLKVAEYETFSEEYRAYLIHARSETRGQIQDIRDHLEENKDL